MISLHTLFSSLALAGTVPQSFSHLKKIDIGGEATLYVEPSVSCTPVDITAHQDGETGYDGPPVYDVCILDFGKTKVKVSYSSGPSADPVFWLYPMPKKGSKSDGRPILEVLATTLYVPKGNNVYAEGWCNTMFNERRKYTYNGTKFIEAKQPYLYVGMKTTVQPLGSDKKPLVLYADKTKKSRVATLPVGSEIEVLIHEKKEWYLIRSSFGLVGWTQIPYGLYDTQIGVRFAGD